MARAFGCLVAALSCCSAQVSGLGDDSPRVLVVYAAGMYDPIKTVANSIGEGASSVGADVRVMEVSSANYKRDVAEWADAVVLGTEVFNGNPQPRLLSFVNTFDFMDDLSAKVGGAFATGGAAAAGLERSLSSLNRGLKTFGMITVGGSTWRNAGGTGVVTTHDNTIGDERHSLLSAFDQGARIATVAARLKGAPLTPGGPGGVAAPNVGVTKLLNSVTESLGRARWSHETKLHATCESYCRGWMAAVGCGTCSPDAFSGGAFFDLLCVQPGPTGTGLLCRMDQDTLEPTGESCCGEGGPCELPAPAPIDADDTSPWPGSCCHQSAGHAGCDACPGGSPVSDRFPLLNDTRTSPENRRYFDYSTNTCMLGTQPSLLL